ncbi:MAG: glycine--tRNA ligase [Verrucomicrobia bacterium]|nr:glycine--tRNA ligase [Verrucomicrobiota bacterium]
MAAKDGARQIKFRRGSRWTPRRLDTTAQSSEIYGGINGFWDYGPLGAELKRNVKESWWRHIVHNRDDVAGLEATIIMHPQIWRASGHVDTFSDPMCDCLLTKKRFRADQVESQSGIVFRFKGAEPGQKIPEADLRELDKAVEDLLKAYPSLAASEAEPYVQVYRNTAKDLGGLQSVQVALSKGPHSVQQFRELFDDFLGVYEKPSNESFSVLLPAGKPPEAARKVAKQFYELGGVNDPQLTGESTERVENSTAFNPENGAELTPPRPFNLMFKTYVGPTATEADVAYLRPETAQAIFAQFKNVLETSRQRVPFGIAQMGKAFRNEVTPRNFTFRSREFEQMELEFFIKPDEAVEAISNSVTTATDGHPGEPQPAWGWQTWHKYWVEERIRFYEGIGLPRTTLEEYWQKPEELAHYARACVDILFKFPFGTQELEGIAARSDFDLSQHQRCSGKAMNVFDDELKNAWAKLDKAKQDDLWRRYCEARKKYLMKMGEPEEKASAQARTGADGLAKGYYVPHVIEPSAGVDRLILALITNAYFEETTTDEKGKTETRVVMRFHPRIAPVKVGVFPLLKNRPELVKKATEVRDLLRPHMTVFYDEAGSIGRRYARQDEAGTPFGVTIDFDTLGEKGDELKDTVTLRDRDTQKQERVKISDLVSKLVPLIR